MIRTLVVLLATSAVMTLAVLSTASAAPSTCAPGYKLAAVKTHIVCVLDSSGSTSVRTASTVLGGR